MKTPPIIKSPAEVLAELQQKHPELVQHVEPDRSWLWLVWDGRGEQNKAVRESIGRQGIGFQFAPQGHTLASGLVAHWGHSCDAPRRHIPKNKRPNRHQSVSDVDLLAVMR